LTVVLADSKMREFVEVCVNRMFELQRKKRLSIVVLYCDHLEFILLFTLSNFVAESAVAKDQIVVVSVALNREYRNYHLPYNSKNPKYEHKDSDCVIALSVGLLPITAQWTICKNFEYYYRYICNQGEDDVWHLSVLDEVDANQKSDCEQ